MTYTPSHTRDTIVALATAAGPAARAIVRLSGPGCRDAVRAVFRPADPLPERHELRDGELHLLDVVTPLPATLYFFPQPHSYTGQDVAELHLLSCPPLVERLVARLLEVGCRAAQPGEFTLRAFLAGKLDLSRAEAVHAVIDATGRGDLRQALAQLAGGLARPLAALREDLWNLLADVEAGLDFADEDIRFVESKEMLLRLGSAMAQVINVGKQLDSRAVAGQTYRVVLAGRPNAGKSSLFNALAGAKALVSELPGTTRDYLIAKVAIDGVTVELIDTPGWQPAADGIEGQAQALGREQQAGADLVLLCVAAGAAVLPAEAAVLGQDHPPVERIATKSDLVYPERGWLATSAVTSMGLRELRQRIVARAGGRPQPALAPSVSRCREHVRRCLDHLRRAHAVALEGDPPEILALELREALQQLGEMAGAVHTDDLLDRVFSRFCIGK